MIYIYTDGACSNNQADKNFGGWAAILVYGDYNKKISGYEMNTSNNRMEMMGVIGGLRSLKRYDIPVRIFSDSAYIVNCINEKWYLNWRRNGWKTSKKEAVLNRELWEEILEYYERCKDIEFIKIKGHVKAEDSVSLESAYKKQLKNFKDTMSIEEYKTHIEYNNLVDELAVEAAKIGRNQE